jgi:hypothetical protein
MIKMKDRTDILLNEINKENRTMYFEFWHRLSMGEDKGEGDPLCSAPFGCWALRVVSVLIILSLFSVVD